MHIHNKDVPPPIEELRLSKVDRPMERGRYTWEKKYATVTVYLTNGSLRETEEKTGVPSTTIEAWRKTPWWDNLVSQIKETNATQLDNKLSKLIKKALGVIDDRLENGELVLNNKTGEMVRKPVGVRDATRAASELLQRQHQINKIAVETQVKQQTIEETLKLLAIEFARMNTKKPLEYVEEVSDAIYEERETGLQTGSSSVHE